MAGQVDLPAFMDQLKETGSFWMAVVELTASHPFLCKRAAALRKLTHSDQIAAVSRNPFAWIFAPALGAMSGGSASAPLIIVAIIAIMAAIAIPNFQRYQAQMRQAALSGAGPAATSAPDSGDEAASQLSAEDRESLEWVKQVRARIAAEEKKQANAPEEEEEE